jgi:hypothetical protein
MLILTHKENGNQNDIEIPSYPHTEWLSSRIQTTNAGEDYRGLGTKTGNNTWNILILLEEM